MELSSVWKHTRFQGVPYTVATNFCDFSLLNFIDLYERIHLLIGLYVCLLKRTQGLYWFDLLFYWLDGFWLLDRN
jgi:hypothetical protein